MTEYESDGKVNNYGNGYDINTDTTAMQRQRMSEQILAKTATEPLPQRPATWLDIITPATMPSPWTPPNFDPVTRKAINKLGEENSELTTVLFRIQNQTDGLDAIIPGETKTNRQWLEEEIADVMATSALAVKHLKLDLEFIEQRAKKKTVYLEKWYMLEPIDPEGHKE